MRRRVLEHLVLARRLGAAVGSGAIGERRRRGGGARRRAPRRREGLSAEPTHARGCRAPLSKAAFARDATVHDATTSAAAAESVAETATGGSTAWHSPSETVRVERNAAHVEREPRTAPRMQACKLERARNAGGGARGARRRPRARPARRSRGAPRTRSALERARHHRRRRYACLVAPSELHARGCSARSRLWDSVVAPARLGVEP